MIANIVKHKRFIFISLVFTLFLGAFLRLYKIDKNPVSLFGDELDVGYQALSLLKTGRDYSGNFLPMHLQSLAEWRTPLYIYASIPTVAIFGISPFGVRLPAAIFGILGILVTYFLAKELTKNKYISLISAFLLTILPWHILYSRTGFEVTMLYTFFFAGILFFLYGLKNNRWLIPSAILLGFTPWIYSTAKLFLPLTVIVLFIIWCKDIFKIKKTFLISASIIFLLITIPFAINTLFGQGVARFDSISIFNRPTISGEVGSDRVRDTEMGGLASISGLQKIFHNKFIVYGNILVSNSQKPGIHGKVQVHGDTGASVGVQTDGGAMFIAGRSSVAEPPVNDLWTIPGEENMLKEWIRQDTEIFNSFDPTFHYMGCQIEDFLHALANNTDPLVTGEFGRKTVELFTAIYRSARDNMPVKFPLKP